MHLKMSLSFPLPLSFAFPSAQDEVDQSASVEDLEKQIEKLAKVNITVAGLTGNQTESHVTEAKALVISVRLTGLTLYQALR